jgi:hypothetical protein
MKSIVNKLYRKPAAVILMLAYSAATLAQQPTHYSGENEPIPLTVGNVLLYIVTPIILFLIYYNYRKSQKKKREKENNS